MITLLKNSFPTSIAWKFSSDQSTALKFSRDQSTALKFSRDQSTALKFSRDQSTALKINHDQSTASKFSRDQSTALKINRDQSSTRSYPGQHQMSLTSYSSKQISYNQFEEQKNWIIEWFNTLDFTGIMQTWINYIVVLCTISIKYIHIPNNMQVLKVQNGCNKYPKYTMVAINVPNSKWPQ